MQTLVRVPLFIIDDFGLKPLRQGRDEDLHDLVAERYERSSTIVTSNLDFNESGEAFPNNLLGAATLDRLRHRTYKVVLDGKSIACYGHQLQDQKQTLKSTPKTINNRRCLK